MLLFHRSAIPGLFVAAWLAGGVRGSAGITQLFDEFDSPFAVGAVQEQDGVKRFRKALDAIQEAMRYKSHGEIEQLLGRAGAMPLKTHAIPIAQARMLCVLAGGKRPVNRQREFYAIKDIGGLEVWYGDDGESPILVLVRLKVDKSFPKLTEKNLEQRLAWDRERFQKLVKFVEEREKELKKAKGK